jgi:hypothetical protein
MRQRRNPELKASLSLIAESAEVAEKGCEVGRLILCNLSLLVG